MKKNLKPVEMFLAAGLAAGLVACGPSTTPEAGEETVAPEATEEMAPAADEGGEGEAEAPAEADEASDEGGEGGEG